MKQRIRSTTILCVRRDGKVVMAGDGQVTLGSEVLKASAQKLRRLYNGKIMAGFAGATADAFALFADLKRSSNSTTAIWRASVVELAKDWRTDRMLRHLEALLLVADTGRNLHLSGNGDVIEPDDNIAAIGSGRIVRESGGQRAVSRTRNFPRGRSSKRPWRSRARSASTRMTA